MMYMHKVKSAIILAAGKGERLKPITNRIPKPMIPVNGKRMIETILDGLVLHGIEEIYIVVGHLKESFYMLKEAYPNIQFIENPYYKECNNISALYVARDYIGESIILDGDQVVMNTDILNPNFDRSSYNCIWTDAHTNEWVLHTNDGIVESCDRDGGEKGWQLYSVSRWTAEDGLKLKKHLEMEFDEKRHRDIYWDDVALFCYPTEYQLGVIPMNDGDIVEIDNLDELVTMDPSYRSV